LHEIIPRKGQHNVMIVYNLTECINGIC